jgi:hypothetical protein
LYHTDCFIWKRNGVKSEDATDADRNETMVHKYRGQISAQRNKICKMIGIYYTLAQTVIFSCAFMRVFNRMRVVCVVGMCYNKGSDTDYVPGK